jgi:hypothetical protein
MAFFSSLLGKRIEFGSREGLWREIVGIVGDVKQQGRRPIDAFVVYAPFRQFADFEAFVIAKSSPIPPEQLTRAVTTAVHAVDPISLSMMSPPWKSGSASLLGRNAPI